MSAPGRGSTDLSGILVIDKPSGMTSHDVVTRVRKATGERRVGHAGTLDPAATGVLVVLVGPATRLAPYLTADRKSYVARIVFGARTETDDAEGEVIEEAPVPAACADSEAAASVLAGLLGASEQAPPAYSAIKREGRVAHRAARAGTPLRLEPRAIEVFDASLLAVDPGPPVTWDISLAVSKGTYVRAIARDLGTLLESAAHLGALRRTASGEAELATAHHLEEIAELGAGGWDALFTDPLTLLDMSVIELDDTLARQAGHGAPIQLTGDADAVAIPSGSSVALVHSDRLLAIYRPAGRTGTFTAKVVLPGGIGR